VINWVNLEKVTDRGSPERAIKYGDFSYRWRDVGTFGPERKLSCRNKVKADQFRC